MRVELTDYKNDGGAYLLVPLTITVDPCVVTSISSPTITDKDYMYGYPTSTTRETFTYVPFTFTPNCNYAMVTQAYEYDSVGLRGSLSSNI